MVRIEGYTNEKITYDKEAIKAKGKYAVVNTTIVTDVNIPIDYKLIFKNDKWQIYDVIVEGVSFISNVLSEKNGLTLTRTDFHGTLSIVG